MTNRNYHTPSNYLDHATFGGLIYFTDFNTDHRGKNEKQSQIANRIINDWKFDQACKKNRENYNTNRVKKGN